MVLRLRLSDGGGKGQGGEGGEEEELGKHFEIGDGYAETVGFGRSVLGGIRRGLVGLDFGDGNR